MQSIDSVPVLNHFEDESLEAEIKILYKSIEKLNPVDTAIILLYLEEKSYDEISEIVGLSSKNISVKIVRIKRKLGKIYESLI
jgi:RNA polymerase sigma-70 factor (ECF subfamily)